MRKKRRKTDKPPTKATVKKLAYRGEIRDTEDLSIAELARKLKQKVEKAPTETVPAIAVRLEELGEVIERLNQAYCSGGNVTGAIKRAQGAQTKARIRQAEALLLAKGERVTNKTIAKEIGGGMHPDHIRRIRKRTQGG